MYGQGPIELGSLQERGGTVPTSAIRESRKVGYVKNLQIKKDIDAKSGIEFKL